MSQQILMPAASDMHVHLRQGDMLRRVAKYSEQQCSRIMVMPNTNPPIATGEEAQEYAREIKSLIPSVEILTTIKLLPTTTPEMIRRARDMGVVAAKLYPCGVTTNSNDGIPVEMLETGRKGNKYRDLYLTNPNEAAPLMAVIKEMENVGMVLCIHGEMPGESVLDAEAQFLDFVMFIHTFFESLKIVLEHITTKEAVSMVKSYGNDYLAATITPHHLALTIDDVVGDKIRPWNFCKPIAKRNIDRASLLDAATCGYRCFFLGSDSAPHTRETKECSSGCAGIWNAPVLIPSLMRAFESYGMKFFEGFTTRNAERFYGLQQLEKKILLDRQDWVVPDEIEGMVPFLSGVKLKWKVSNT